MLKKFRERRGYSLRKLGNMVDISAQSLSAIELHKTTGRIETYIKLGKALQIDWWRLIDLRRYDDDGNEKKDS